MKRNLIVAIALVAGLAMVLMTASGTVSASVNVTPSVAPMDQNHNGNSNQLQAAQTQLTNEFYNWYNSSNYRNVQISNPNNRLSIFEIFVNTSQTYQTQLQNVANLEEMNATGSNSAIPIFAMPIGNQRGDPYILFYKEAVTLLGIPVGEVYYYYLEYTGDNALNFYQGVVKQMSDVNLVESLIFGFGAAYGAAEVAGLIGLSTVDYILSFLFGAIATVLAFSLLQSEISTFTNAFYSTYENGNYIEYVWQQTVLLDGVSDAIGGWTWNANSNQFVITFGPVPEIPGANYLNGFDTLVNNGISEYGSSNWAYVDQTVEYPL